MRIEVQQEKDDFVFNDFETYYSVKKPVADSTLEAFPLWDGKAALIARAYFFECGRKAEPGCHGVRLRQLDRRPRRAG